MNVFNELNIIGMQIYIFNEQKILAYTHICTDWCERPFLPSYSPIFLCLLGTLQEQTRCFLCRLHHSDQSYDIYGSPWSSECVRMTY